MRNNMDTNSNRASKMDVDANDAAAAAAAAAMGMPTVDVRVRLETHDTRHTSPTVHMAMVLGRIYYIR